MNLWKRIFNSYYQTFLVQVYNRLESILDFLQINLSQVAMPDFDNDFFSMNFVRKLLLKVPNQFRFQNQNQNFRPFISPSVILKLRVLQIVQLLYQFFQSPRRIKVKVWILRVHFELLNFSFSLFYTSFSISRPFPIVLKCS